MVKGSIAPAPRRKSRFRKTTTGDIVIIGFMLVLIALCILPIMNVVATSFSSPGAIIRQEVVFLPVEFHVGAFADVLSDSRFMWSLAWTGILTAIVVVVNLIMTILCAYPLTYMSLKGRKLISFLIIFTMLFSAGLIPAFVLFRDLNLLDNPLVLILPGMISVFNMIIMRNFFMGIPDSLKESAEIDGLGPFRILIYIYLPLSTPVLATIGLFYAVGRWNGFQDALFFLSGAPQWHPIQLLLYNILQNIVAVDALDPGATAAPGWGTSVQAAAIVIAMVPILCVYPFIQKYFVQGATLGAIKG
ncbi:MAG: carbohydrate ABC transporter permease [Defluviitaleaceae bacterium]|nr:carbohydrate ABC transporter permease [Defluviitaleaceae bacterium]